MSSLFLVSIVAILPMQTGALVPWTYESLVENVAVSVVGKNKDLRILIQGDVKKGANPCEAAHGETRFITEVVSDSLVVTPTKLLSPMIRQVCALYYAPIFEKTVIEIDPALISSTLVIENYRNRGETKQIDMFDLIGNEVKN